MPPKKLHRDVLYAHEWFWRDWFTHMQQSGREFVNQEEARKAHSLSTRATAPNSKGRALAW